MHACLSLVVLAGLAQAPAFEPRRLAFSPDGQALAVGGAAGKAGMFVLYDVKTRRPRWRVPLEQGVSALGWASGGQTLVVACGPSVVLVEPATGKERGRFGPHGMAVRSLAVSPGGGTVATGGDDRCVRLWELAGGKELKELAGHKGPVASLAFSPDGRLLAGAGGGEARLWDVKEGKVRHTLTHGEDHLSTALFAARGRVVVTGGSGGVVSLWDPMTGRSRGKLELMGSIKGAAHGEAGHTLAVWGFGRAIRLVRLNLGPPDARAAKRIAGLLRELDDDRYEARQEASRKLLGLGFLAWDELRRAVSDSPSAEVRIRARAVLAELAGKPRLHLRGHKGDVRDAALAPDGRTLASASADGSVRLWEVESGKELAVLR
jgi:WD40 repeat protein